MALRSWRNDSALVTGDAVLLGHNCPSVAYGNTGPCCVGLICSGGWTLGASGLHRAGEQYAPSHAATAGSQILCAWYFHRCTGQDNLASCMLNKVAACHTPLSSPGKEDMMCAGVLVVGAGVFL
jgi:hypothetical protein